MRYVRAISVLALILALACGDSGPTSLDSDVVESVDIIENESLTVEANKTSDTVTAVLKDADGNPVAGQLSSWEINGGDEKTCGFWASSTLESNSSGEVKNVLNASKLARTSFSGDRGCVYRVVHSRDGAPEPVIDSVEVTVEPGPAVKLSVNRVIEDGTTLRDGRDDNEARATLEDAWQDVYGNPALYEAAVTDGPAEILGGTGEVTWPRTVKPTGAVGTGTVELWTRPDSSETVTGTFEVWHYGPENNETWICVFFSAQDGDETCEGPPTL